MAFELDNFADDTLDLDYLCHLVDHQSTEAAIHYGRLWDYFRNPLLPLAAAPSSCARPYVQAQEAGLPARITGVPRGPSSDSPVDLRRKEVVIENDIAWRIHTMIDFLFGKAPTIRSKAADPALAGAIESVLQALLDANGSAAFLHELALFGSVYGFVDVALRIPAQEYQALPLSASPWRTGNSPAADANAPTEAGPVTSTPASAAGPAGDRSNTQTRLQRAIRMAREMTLETVEAPRVLPILDEDDYRSVRYWVQRYCKHPARMNSRRRSFWGLPLPGRDLSPAQVEVIEIISPYWWQRYEDRTLVAQGPNALGRLPIVHIQNLAVPGSYDGLGDVEPLMGLQDELNTRLSDRANRVTYQSFKMYLGKGIDGFLERPVGPGQMWATDNVNASVEEFGSDTGSPSEDVHIEQVRQAMDKVSGVTPLAAGLISGNVGNLTSATALKVLLSGLLAKTQKKRLTYGAGLSQIAQLVLEYMDLAGVLRTRPEDRQIEIHWSDPLPQDESEQLRNAQIKAALGVPTEQLLTELGYNNAAQGR